MLQTRSVYLDQEVSDSLLYRVDYAYESDGSPSTHETATWFAQTETLTPGPASRGGTLGNVRTTESRLHPFDPWDVIYDGETPPGEGAPLRAQDEGYQLKLESRSVDGPGITEHSFGCEYQMDEESPDYLLLPRKVAEDPDLHSTTYAYERSSLADDPDGINLRAIHRVVECEEPHRAPQDQVTPFHCDLRNHQIWIRSAEGKEIWRDFDAMGRLESETTPTATGSRRRCGNGSWSSIGPAMKAVW